MKEVIKNPTILPVQKRLPDRSDPGANESGDYFFTTVYQTSPLSWVSETTV